MSDDREDVEPCTHCDRPVFANCDICGWPVCGMHGSIIDERFVCTQCRTLPTETRNEESTDG